MHRKKEHAKRIGLVLNSVPKYSETFFRNKIKGLQANGFEVLLFVDSYPVQGDAGLGCPVVVSPDFSQRNLGFLKGLVSCLVQMFFVNPKRSLKLYRLNHDDGLGFKRNLRQLLLNQHFLNQSLDWLHFGFGTLARGRETVAGAIGAKLGVSFRGFDLYLSPLKHENCFDLLFKKEVKYHVLAEEMKADLIAQGVKGASIHVITPAIDVDFFTPQKDFKRSVQPFLRFTTISRLHWKKGLEYTLEALALLKKESIPFHYTIVGTGEAYERLVFAVHQLGLTSEVSFAGKRSPEEVRALLEATDIYLQYSVQEGFCNAVLEAQAMGLLCVVSDAEGLSENVLHEHTGWVVPKRAPKLLKDTLLEVQALGEAAKQQVQAHAMARVRERFTLHKQNQAFVDFYTE